MTEDFCDLPDLAIAPDMLTLAEHILDSKAGEFDRATPAQREQWCCWIGRRRIISGSAEIAAILANSAMQLADQRSRQHDCQNRGPSCASATQQLKRE
jgi:hypothetical protein